MHSHTIYLPTYLPVCVYVQVPSGESSGEDPHRSLRWLGLLTEHVSPGSDLESCFGQGSLQQRVVSVRSVTVFTVLIVVVVVVVYLCVVVVWCVVLW